jgi:hypothetical protein
VPIWWIARSCYFESPEQLNRKWSMIAASLVALPAMLTMTL